MTRPTEGKRNVCWWSIQFVPQKKCICNW